MVPGLVFFVALLVHCSHLLRTTHETLFSTHETWSYCIAPILPRSALLCSTPGTCFSLSVYNRWYLVQSYSVVPIAAGLVLLRSTDGTLFNLTA